MEPEDAAEMGLSLAQAATSLTDLGATSVGEQTVTEFRTTLLTSFIGIMDASTAAGWQVVGSSSDMDVATIEHEHASRASERVICGPN